MNILINLFNDYTFQIVAIGALALGILSGITGTYAVLRKQSLLGDSIAHASLAGIACAFLLTQTRNTEVLLLGALIVGLLCTAIINFFSRNTRVNFESAMALVMASFFGLGLMLLTEIQKVPNSNQAGLERFLFGQAATIVSRDVWLSVIVLGVVLVMVLLFWKELKVLSFDPIFASTLGYKYGVYNTILSGFVVITVIVGIQMVGVVLMSALLIAPAVAARQWTQSLVSMMFTSALFGAVSGVSGVVISSSIPNFPAGPAIVVCMSVLVGISLLFAPGRGLVTRVMRKRFAQTSFQADMVLIHYMTHHNHGIAHQFTQDDLYKASVDEHKWDVKSWSTLINNLMKRKIISKVSDTSFVLTETGAAQLIPREMEVHNNVATTI